MKKIGIVYFSGTGNTKFVAENIKDVLEEYGEDADLINIEEDMINTIDYKKIIIGGPVYVDRYPEILLQFIEKNLKSFTFPVMLFTTQASDKASTAFQHCINRFKNLNVVYCLFVTMPNNFYNFLFKMSTKEEEGVLIKKAIFFIRTGVEEFLNGNIKMYPQSKFKVKMIDKVYHIIYPNCIRYLTKRININTEKCNECKLCERRCPAKCIKIENGVTFNTDCVFCQRCMCSCPKEAFLYKD